MNSSAKSIRRIIRTSTVTGGASAISICLSLIRTKAAAVLLGPSGIGIVGVLQNLLTVTANIASLGFRTSGTRAIAESSAKQDPAALDTARRALFWGTAVLALVGGLAIWLLRDLLAQHLLHEPARAWDIGWLSVGVVLAVAAGSQTALLSGMRRIGDLARIGIASSALATLLGTAALAMLGSRGVLLFVLAGPAATFLLGLWFASKLTSIAARSTPLRDLISKWRNFALLGIAFMLSGFVENLGELAVRSLVIQQGGLPAAGHFQAAWAISAMYTSFVLSSMAADFYPRLSASLHDHLAVNRLINEQTQVALLLAGPLLVLMLGCAPWVIRLLYSASFADAANVLRWQLVGDVLKVACWPLAYLLLASGDGRRYFLTATAMAVVFVSASALLLPRVGLEATGQAFLLMYAAYLPMVYWIARQSTAFAWSRSVKRLFLATTIATSAVFVTAQWSEIVALVFGAALAACFGAYSARRLRSLSRSEMPHDPTLRSA